MSRWIAQLAQFLVVGAAVVLAGCGGQDATTRSESNNGYGPNSPGGGAAPVPGPSTTPGGANTPTGGQHSGTGGPSGTKATNAR